jgi:hypothetical protein
MSVTAGTGGSGTVGATAEYLYNVATGGVTAMQIWNTGTTNGLKVLVTGMHDSGAECCIPPSGTTVLRLGTKELRQIAASAAAGTTEVYWGVCALTGQEW